VDARELTNAQITIAVPSFNQGRYLDEALSSIFAQDIPVEVFVLDGSSTDDSLDIIQKWESKLAGWRSHSDKGQAEAINEGIAQGSAPYVCWLNSDDYFYPGGLKRLLQSLENHADKQFAYGRCWTVMKSGRKLLPYLTLPFSPRMFANFCCIAQPATLITRPAWAQAGGVDERMQLAFDYDLWWRLYRSYGKPAYCRDFVAATRIHKDTKTANQPALHYRESMQVVKRHWGTVPPKWWITRPLMKLIRKKNGRYSTSSREGQNK